MLAMHRRLVFVPVRIVTTVEILSRRVMKVKLEKGAAEKGNYQLLHTLPVHSNIAFDVDSFVLSRRVQNVVFTQSVRNGGKRNASGSRPLWVS